MSVAAGDHFTDQRTGFVAEARAEHHRANGTVAELRSYWYGPDHGWGTTSGPLDYSARVWRSRTAAMRALDSVYGTAAAWLRRGYRVRRLEDVLAEHAAK